MDNFDIDNRKTRGEFVLRLCDPGARVGWRRHHLDCAFQDNPCTGRPRINHAGLRWPAKEGLNLDTALCVGRDHARALAERDIASSSTCRLVMLPSAHSIVTSSKYRPVITASLTKPSACGTFP